MSWKFSFNFSKFQIRLNAEDIQGYLFVQRMQDYAKLVIMTIIQIYFSNVGKLNGQDNFYKL